MTAFLGKKSLCHAGNRICWVLAGLCTGSAGNSHAWWALYALIFWGREKRRRSCSSREGTGNQHSGTFHDPGATSGKHQSLQFQHYICISRTNATWGTRLPKNRCSSFLLVKNSKFLCCRSENLVTLVRGQGSVTSG